MLDADEHLHLALHAISVRDHHAALSRLHDVLALRPDDARARYLLAVQHGALGLVPRAIDGLTAALALEPGLEMARFQLGLMLLETHRTADAKQQLEQLAGSGDEALRRHAQGLIALAEGRTAVARQLISEGLAQEPRNPALAELMQRLLAGFAEEGKASATAPAAAPVALGAYAAGSGAR